VEPARLCRAEGSDATDRQLLLVPSKTLRMVDRDPRSLHVEWQRASRESILEKDFGGSPTMLQSPRRRLSPETLAMVSRNGDDRPVASIASIAGRDRAKH
jgi:hypothetical protein